MAFVLYDYEAALRHLASAFLSLSGLAMCAEDVRMRYGLAGVVGP